MPDACLKLGPPWLNWGGGSLALTVCESRAILFRNSM